MCENNYEVIKVQQKSSNGASRYSYAIPKDVSFKNSIIYEPIGSVAKRYRNHSSFMLYINKIEVFKQTSVFQRTMNYRIY
ncbi:hypothetical protein BAGA_16920 [Bacillus gaemokensis]|uniref:Uncharacterized protein n=1 Tax=Bacillus gaemokensis TaxID=574375 RepID=A0A073K852_9BACI|nr:hypothetical protein BAGA_16920 [Bacillus gaemokensis]